MVSYFRVSPKFWRDTRGWPDQRKIVALYLITNEHRTTEGLYFLPKGYVQSDLDYSPRLVARVFGELERERFAEYDEDAQVVLVRSALKYQAPATDNQIKGAVRKLMAVPSTRLAHAFLMACESHCPNLADAIRNEDGMPFDPSSSSSNSSSFSSGGGGLEVQGRVEPERPAPPSATSRGLGSVDGEAA